MIELPADLTGHLVHLLATHSLRRGSFVLSSGATSSYYIDARLTTMRPEGLLTIGRLALTHFAKAHWEPDAVGGLTLGADPVAYAISCASASSAIPIRAFTVRKEPKAHGTQRLIEGPLREGDKVVVVEDVLTTGASTLQAIEAVQAFGAGLLGVLAVVDREEGGAARLRDAGYDVRRLTTVSDILALNS